jgi:hypothetical protein
MTHTRISRCNAITLVRYLGRVSKYLAGLRRIQTTTGGVVVSSGYNTGIRTKRRLAGSPPGPRLGSTEHFETRPCRPRLGRTGVNLRRGES